MVDRAIPTSDFTSYTHQSLFSASGENGPTFSGISREVSLNSLRESYPDVEIDVNTRCWWRCQKTRNSFFKKS